MVYCGELRLGAIKEKVKKSESGVQGAYFMGLWWLCGGCVVGV